MCLILNRSGCAGGQLGLDTDSREYGDGLHQLAAHRWSLRQSTGFHVWHWQRHITTDKSSSVCQYGLYLSDNRTDIEIAYLSADHCKDVCQLYRWKSE